MRLAPVISILILASAAFAQETASKVSISELGWMSGCWKQTRGEGRYTIEEWTKPAGMMIGTSRSYRDGKMTAYEFLRIIEKEGEIFYVAIPSGQKETFFKLTSQGAGEAVFENPAHDFPQRLAYKRSGENGLIARAEAKQDGQVRGFDVVYERIECGL